MTINNNGTAGDATDDFIVYTPTADYNGTDSFTYTVTSGGVTETATVNVTVTAVADIADDSVGVAEDTAVNNLDLLANDTFEDSGRAITAVGAAPHGTTTINDNGTAGDASDDFVTYTPTGNYIGPDSFTYTVTSGGVTETATVTVNISAVNDAPQFAGLDNTPTFTENGSAVVLDGNAHLSDVELDAANNYSGAVLTLVRSGGANAHDVFGASGPLGSSGSDVLVGSTNVGTFTNSGGHLRSPSTGMRPARSDSVLQKITYANNSEIRLRRR